MEKIIEALKKSNNIRIICHKRPDGDAIGSTLALMQALCKLGKNIEIICDECVIQEEFAFIKNYSKFNQRLSDCVFDTAIALDCSDLSRLGAFFVDFTECKCKINIDHHKTNERFGDLNFVDGSMSSTCEIIYNLLKLLNVEIDRDIATALYTGLSTDTGNFMHSNTSASALACASDLVSCGVDVSQITYSVYKKTSLERTKLIGKVLSSARLFYENKICILTIMDEDLKLLNLDSSATSGLVDYAINISSVLVGVCILQNSSKAFKVSMRSKEPVDCSDICSAFGGGGHKLASGCLICGFYEDVIDKIVKAITDRIWYERIYKYFKTDGLVIKRCCG